MSNHMEPLVLDANYEPVEEVPAETPLDTTTEWIGVINRKREEEKQQAQQARQRAARDREDALRKKAFAAEEEEKRYAELLKEKAQKKHNMKTTVCLFGIVLMFLMIGFSFVLQVKGHIDYPWSIVFAGIFGVIAAFFAGIVWESNIEWK